MPSLADGVKDENAESRAENIFGDRKDEEVESLGLADVSDSNNSTAAFETAITFLSTTLTWKITLDPSLHM